jgi:hypothetical protein
MKKINNKSINYSLKILTILAFSLIFVPNNTYAAYGTNIIYQTTDGGYFAKNVNNPKPTINSINPKSSNVGVGTKTITITGKGFVPNSIVRINGVNRSSTFIDNSHLLVQITGNDTSAYRTNGGFFITVYNGAPGGGYSNAEFFTINSPAPTNTTNTNKSNNYNSSTTNFNDTNSNGTFTDNTNTTDNSANNNYSDLASNAVFGSTGFLPSGLIQWILFAIIILLIVILARKIFGAKEEYENSPMKHE